MKEHDGSAFKHHVEMSLNCTLRRFAYQIMISYPIEHLNVQNSFSSCFAYLHYK